MLFRSGAVLPQLERWHAVRENEERYGTEARERYGDEAVDAMNERLLNMDPATWNDMKRLEGAILERLKSAMATGDPTGPEARELVRMHRHWVYKVLATNLKESLTNNNIKTRDLKTTNLYMYRNTNVVGVLVECGFLSNKNDRYLLKTKWYQEKFSKALVEGVIKYFN